MVLRTPKRIIAPDPKVIGDIRRLCRIPGTSRIYHNYNHCTYLPANKFLDLTEGQILDYIKNPYYNNNDVSYDGAPLLTDFEYEFDNDTNYNHWTPLGSIDKIPSNPHLLLEVVLRPCLYKNIIRIHPCHDVRVATTYDLILAGYSPATILNIYSTLGWEDWDDEYTLSQIKGCKSDIELKGFDRYSCTKLRALHIPEVCCVG